MNTTETTIRNESRRLAAIASYKAKLKKLGKELFNEGLEAEVHYEIEQLAQLEQQGIYAIARADPLYPMALREIYDPPDLLYFRGTWQAFTLPPAIAIVGSRRADGVACEISHEFGKLLAKNGNCVVSGLAFGVDGAAHRGALAAKTCESTAATVAVVGSGLDTVYPASHQRLAAEIVERGGLILSQFAPGIPPYPSNFLNRNRVIAGLSLGVVVVQASSRSGSLVSARYALESGREVLVVPGSVRDPGYAGSNALIKQGATLVASCDDIFDALPMLSRTVSEDPNETIAKTELEIILKQRESWTLEELRAEVKDKNEFDAQLLNLELDGRAKRLPGNRVIGAG